MKVRIDVETDFVRLTVRSRNALHEDADHRPSNDKILYLTYPAIGELVKHEHLRDRAFRHEIRVPQRSWPEDPQNLKGVAEIRMITLGLWEVDSHPFPNCASEAVAELMKRRKDAWAQKKLLQYEGIWKGNVEAFNNALDPHSPYYWPGDHWHACAYRLTQNLRRRVLLLAWINLYRKDGFKAALKYARGAGLINGKKGVGKEQRGRAPFA